MCDPGPRSELRKGREPERKREIIRDGILKKKSQVSQLYHAWNICLCFVEGINPVRNVVCFKFRRCRKLKRGEKLLETGEKCSSSRK